MPDLDTTNVSRATPSLVGTGAIIAGLTALVVVVGPLGEPRHQALGAFGVSAAGAAFGRITVAALRPRPASIDGPGPLHQRPLARISLVVILTMGGAFAFGNGGAAAGLAFGFGLVDLAQEPPRGRSLA